MLPGACCQCSAHDQHSLGVLPGSTCIPTRPAHCKEGDQQKPQASLSNRSPDLQPLVPKGVVLQHQSPQLCTPGRGNWPPKVPRGMRPLCQHSAAGSGPLRLNSCRHHLQQDGCPGLLLRQAAHPVRQVTCQPRPGEARCLSLATSSHRQCLRSASVLALVQAERQARPAVAASATIAVCTN